MNQSVLLRHKLKLHVYYNDSPRLRVAPVPFLRIRLAEYFFSAAARKV